MCIFFYDLDPNSKMVTFQARRKEGHYENYKVVQ